MNEDKLQLRQQYATRKTLRRVGILVLGIGGLLTLLGIGSFFGSFGSFEPPRFFWCVFLGMPLIFVGAIMTIFGFMGAIGRYVAGESSPVAKDVINYMGDNTQPGVKSIAKAVTQGIKEGLNEEQDTKR
jgi:hypothetical protein